MSEAAGWSVQQADTGVQPQGILISTKQTPKLTNGKPDSYFAMGIITTSKSINLISKNHLVCSKQKILQKKQQ